MYHFVQKAQHSRTFIFRLTNCWNEALTFSFSGHVNIHFPIETPQKSLNEKQRQRDMRVNDLCVVSAFMC